MIKSFSSLHHRVALFCHNCVKFNGRYVFICLAIPSFPSISHKHSNHYELKYSESDYAVLTRDFEDHVDDKVLEAVRNAAAQQTAAATAVSTVATAPAAPATSEM